MKCDACGREMTAEHDSKYGLRRQSFVGVYIGVVDEFGAFSKVYPELAHFGEDPAWRVCIVCYLKSLGVKIGPPAS
jgi:hypothetical protein